MLKKIIILSIVFILVACGKKDIYSYTEQEKNAIILKAIIDEDEKALEEYHTIMKKLKEDFAKGNKKAMSELDHWIELTEEAESSKLLLQFSDKMESFLKEHEKKN